MKGSSEPLSLGDRFLTRIQGFLDRLREEGLRIGLGAGIDLGHATDLLTSLDRSAFRDACRATLAKSPEDLAIVDRVFDEYWASGGRPAVPPASEEGKVPAPPRQRRGSHPPAGRRRPKPIELPTPSFEGRYSPRAPDSGHALGLVSEPELRRDRIGARRFRRRIATLPGRSWRRAPTGPIDLRRTAGRSARTGGEWIELLRRDRAPRRADLIVLWDVSGSMRDHTSSLFALVHTLHRVIRRTRVFAFGHALEEVTELFEGQSYPRALAELAGRLEATGGGTQIARCLEDFYRRSGLLLRSSTTVLVVSDGWDLGEPGPLGEVLQRIRRSAGRVVWLNPYAAEKGFAPATAALKAALPFVDLMTSPVDFPYPHGGREVRSYRSRGPMASSLGAEGSFAHRD